MTAVSTIRRISGIAIAVIASMSLTACSPSARDSATVDAAAACFNLSVIDNAIAGTAAEGTDVAGALRYALDFSGSAARADSKYEELARDVASFNVAIDNQEKSGVMFLLSAEMECVDLGLLE